MRVSYVKKRKDAGIIYEKSCGGIVLRKRGESYEVILIMHNNTERWSFPKGHVEKDEREHQTAAREIYEETGATVKFINGYRQVTRFSPKPGVRKQVVYFLAWSKTENLRNRENEIKKVCWCPVEKAIDELYFKNDKMLLERALAFLKNRTEKIGDKKDVQQN